MNPADDPNIVENLRTMRVVSTDHPGTEQPFKDQYADETHLLVTALMTADFLERRGQSLRPGDVISVGAEAPRRRLFQPFEASGYACPHDGYGSNFGQSPIS